MAVTYATPIRSLMFLNELESIRFSDSANPSVYTFQVKAGYATLFSNTYAPDADGVTIYDVDKLLESLMTTHYRTFTLVFNGEEVEVTVFKCSVDLDDTGENFLQNYFLSTMMAERWTTYGRYEVLYAYCPEPTQAYARAEYYKDGAITGETFTLGSISGVGYVVCSPSQFKLSDGRELIGYTIACGDRRAEYRVMDSLPDADPSLIFRNCFGVWETMYLTGAKETSGEYTRDQAIMGGKLRNYHVGEVIKHNAHTGPISYGADAIAYDLARSKSVFLLNANGVAGDEIVVLSCKTTKTNEYDHLPDFTFEYRRANKRTDKLSGARPPRIFDDTFDDTFE